MKAGVIKNMTILIVDDQENMCWVLSKILSDAGFSTITARSAKEAISLFTTTNNISAAVIDYRLPESNGFDLSLELRKNNKNLPCILITSYGTDKLRQKALDLGFDDYFDKPFDYNIFVATIKKTLNL
jgi:DNA-binding response OmpR family regulator